jgi:hypothetical protein
MNQEYLKILKKDPNIGKKGKNELTMQTFLRILSRQCAKELNIHVEP